MWVVDNQRTCWHDMYLQEISERSVLLTEYAKTYSINHMADGHDIYPVCILGPAHLACEADISSTQSITVIHNDVLSHHFTLGLHKNLQPWYNITLTPDLHKTIVSINMMDWTSSTSKQRKDLTNILLPKSTSTFLCTMYSWKQF